MDEYLCAGLHTFIIDGDELIDDIQIGALPAGLEVCAVNPPFVRPDGKIEFQIVIIESTNSQ